MGKAGKKNIPNEPTRASIEDALEEARDRLGWLHRLGFLNDDDRVWARRLVMQIEFPKYFWVPGGIGPLREYLLRLLDEKAPGAKKGRPSNKNRDYWIVRVLARLVVMFNLPLTRSRRPAVRPRPGQRAAALTIGGDAYLYSRIRQIAFFALSHRLPTVGSTREHVSAGILMTYGNNQVDTYRQAGVYVGRILKGDKPASLPVAQPTKFELLINVTIAKALGLQVPYKLLAIADEVIE
jgi:hypothetical protein